MAGEREGGRAGGQAGRQKGGRRGRQGGGRSIGHTGRQAVSIDLMLIKNFRKFCISICNKPFPLCACLINKSCDNN